METIYCIGSTLLWIIATPLPFLLAKHSDGVHGQEVESDLKTQFQM